MININNFHFYSDEDCQSSANSLPSHNPLHGYTITFLKIKPEKSFEFFNSLRKFFGWRLKDCVLLNNYFPYILKDKNNNQILLNKDEKNIIINYFSHLAELEVKELSFINSDYSNDELDLAEKWFDSLSLNEKRWLEILIREKYFSD